MAEIWPDEGLDFLLNIFPRNGANIPTLYVGLFTGGTASTVPAASATLGTMGGSFAEVSAGSWLTYARQWIPSTSWSAPGAATINATATRRVVGPQLVFPSPLSTYSTAINGFFVCTVPTGTAGVVVYYANFDDLTAISSVATTDQVKLTPTLALAN